MAIHEHMMCKTNCVIGNIPIQTTTPIRYNQTHNPRMHDHVKIMKKNAMHDHMKTNTKNPTQKF